MNSLVPPGTFALLILAISVVYGERVNLAIVSAWHLVLWTSLLYWQRYIVVSLPIDKCAYCKSLWIKGECKSLFWRPVHTETQSPVAVNKAFENQLPPLGFSHTYSRLLLVSSQGPAKPKRSCNTNDIMTSIYTRRRLFHTCWWRQRPSDNSVRLALSGLMTRLPRAAAS